MWFTERTGNRIGRITASGAISEFPIPTSASEPVGIASGPSGTIWFTEAAAHKIGVVTRNGVVREFSIAAPTPAVNSALARMSAASAYGPPGSRITVISLHIPGRAASTAVFSNPSYIGGMTLGPDGRPWFTEPSANIVATLQADGTVRLLPIKLPVNKCDCAEPTSDNLGGIVAGPDHNLWFTVDFEQVGKLTPSGKVTLYSLPTPDDVPSGLTAGSDGNLWFLDWADGGNGSYLARLTPQGQLTRMRAPSDLVTSGVANGPGKTMWFTGSGDSDLVERYDLSSHRFATFPMPTDESLPGTMLMGRDGRIWLAEPSANELAAISAQGSVAEYPLPSGGPGQASTEPNALVTGPDGHLWFLETAANRLCRVNSPGNVTEYALPPLGGNLAWTPGNLIVDRDGSFWYTVSGEAKDGGSGPGSAALVHVSLSRQHSSLGTTETARHS
jgi:streptogramin lyase